MSDPSIARFLAYLNGNHELRHEVEHLERSLAAAFKRQAEAVAAIAVDAGFDTSDWSARAGTQEPGSIKPFECCGFMTSGTERLEEALKS